MHKDFIRKNLSEDDLHAIRYDGEFWRRFISSEILIRSIYDKSYPDNSDDFPGFYKAEVFAWYHNGLEVRAHPYGVSAKVRYLKDEAEYGSENPKDYDVVECKLEVFGCVPFESIIEYDTDGDEYYKFPHLFCDYQCGSEPYEQIRYRDEYGRVVKAKDIVEILSHK